MPYSLSRSRSSRPSPNIQSSGEPQVAPSRRCIYSYRDNSLFEVYLLLTDYLESFHRNHLWRHSWSQILHATWRWEGERICIFYPPPLPLCGTLPPKLVPLWALSRRMALIHRLYIYSLFIGHTRFLASISGLFGVAAQSVLAKRPCKYPGPRGFLSPRRDETREKEAARENLW